MKKLIVSAVSLLAVGLTAMAVPARQGFRPFVQPDGTTIMLQLVGDENCHSLMTADGLTVSRADNGTYCYTVDGRLTDVAVSPETSRSDAERAFINANASAMSLQSKAAAIAATDRITPAESRAHRVAARRASQVPQTGSPRIPVLLVQYTDVKFIDGDKANETFVNFFEEGETGARQYFVDQSNGLYNPQFDIYGPYTLKRERAYYGANDSYGMDKRLGAMVAEGCIGLQNEIDYSIYDNDGDGVCDVLIMLYAGEGEADSYEDNSIWPCQWELSASDYGRNLKFNGITVSKFAVFNESNGTYYNRLNGIGTFCHEFSHCLDLPDFYDTNYKYFGMAAWSLMDSGCYNNDGYTPIGYSAYEKNFMGWIDLPEVKANTHYTLPVLNQKNIETDKAVKITNDADPDEYFIIENRAKQGWDAYMPAEGLLIYHVTYNADAWYNNCVNDYAMQRMTPIPADGALKMSQGSPNKTNLKGDLWPYGTADELTDSSIPQAKVNTGGYMHKPVTEMKRNNDGTISFWFMKSATGIDAVESDDDATAEYFNLQGIRVAAPAKGSICIRRSGSTVEKVVVK